MAMDDSKAIDITIACIKNVGKHKDVSEGQQLSETGIDSPDLVNALINRISLNKEIGVPSVGFEINFNEFHWVDVTFLVSDVSDIVAANAMPKGE